MLILLRSLALLSTCVCFATADYWKDRQDLINNEENMMIGNKLKLTSKEKIVNNYLMAAKRKELNCGFLQPESFSPARHFFEARENIVNSEVFKIILKMPKGGALHVHDLAMSGTDYVLNNITYRDHLYRCESDDKVYFKFTQHPENNCALVRDLRKRDKNFDVLLKNNLTLVTKNPYEKYTDVNTVWKAFIQLFITLGPMITYRPVFEDYFYNSLTEFYHDNVNYMEIRGTLPRVYDLDGTIYNEIQVLGILKNVANKFESERPDFIGIKYIYAPTRFVTNETMDKYILTYKKLKETYPNFLLGFDLVGQEDSGKPLSSFITQLTSISQDTKFFFHAGETNWNGMSTDLNLVDAILLNTTRIGHGYAILKHPLVLKQVKKRQIGIEVNPISNQVLNLVKDLRNHPANILIAQNYPVVISSDDPGFWNASGLSFDFYEAFMGMANSNADLKLLKQFALNSLYYSALNRDEKALAVRKFLTKWNQFIHQFAKTINFSVRRV